MNLFQEIKERKIRKWITIYTSSVITIIGLVQLFSFRYNLPDSVFNIILIIMICGFLSALIVSWFHGKAGRQKVQKVEIVLHSIVVLIAMSFIWLWGFPKTNLYYHTLEKQSVAVLPFKNYSDLEDNEFFSDGVTEDILTDLSKIRGLKVTSRTSVMKYKDSDKSIREIGDELGVEAILEGSVRQYGNKVRITGQLIDVRTDKHIWAESYDRELKDIFSIQSEVAEKIAQVLEQKLTTEEKNLIENKPTQNIEAYALYLKGRELYYRFEEDKNENAIEYFKKAVKLDSGYALAYAGISDAYIQKVSKYWQSRNWVDSAEIMAEKSVSINPELAEGYKALGLVEDTRGNIDNALYNYQRAIDINPNYWPAVFNIADVYYSIGRLDEAIKYSNESIRLAPDNVYSYVLSAMCYEIIDDTVSSLKLFGKALELEPRHLFALSQLGWHYLTANDLKQAQKISDSLLTVNPEWPLGLDFAAAVAADKKDYNKAKDLYLKIFSITGSEPDYHLAYVYKMLGLKKQAEKILNDEILKNAGNIEENKIDRSTLLDQMYINVLLGKQDEALKFAQLAIDKGYMDYKWLRFDPMLNDIRKNPRFLLILDGLESKVREMKNNLKHSGDTL